MSDPGLQPERTGLAWSRTGLVALLTVCLSIRTGMSIATFVHLFVASVLAVMACAVLYRGHYRSQQRNYDRIVTEFSRRLLLAISVAIAIVSCVYASLILVRQFQ